MKQPIFTGVCTALVTPFLHNEINYPLLERLLERQILSGVSSVVLAGTTGEAPTLRDEEKVELITRAKSFTGGDCTIIAGTGTNSTAHAIEMSKQAEKAGADAVLVVSPYYNKGNPSGLIQHFTRISQSISIPVILYNVPSRTGFDVPVAIYKELSAIPNVIGVKEASTDITKIAKIRYACKEDFTIWSGNDDQIVPVISMGGKGIISVLSNLCPEETVDMATAALRGDFAKAAAYQAAFAPLIELLFSEVNPVPLKYAMRYAGFDCGECRLPLGPISKASKKRIDALLG